MSRSDDHDDGDKTPRLTPTAIDQVSPFDSTTARRKPAPPHETQLSSESDPPTAIVSRGGFRELPPGTVVGDNYEIDAKLGAGAMGEVYAARHIGLGKRVAIKVIGRRLSEDAAAIERFAMEAKTLAQIQHPAIVAVEHVGELADGRAYFVMEYLRGESLFERLERGRVPLPEALRILDQMARGLDAAHGEGVVHRDVKPENTFLVHLPGEPSIVKLVDFGLAKLRVRDQRAERTQSGVAIGTPMYMSPEQMRGQGVDHRTDVYALGCVAYELMLGQSPFPNARTTPELYAAHLHESPPLPRSIWPEIPPQLDLMLFAMIAKDPSHRPTLEQVRTVVATVAEGRPAGDHAATVLVGPRAPRVQAKTIAIAVATLAFGVAIGILLTSRSSEKTPPIAPTMPIATPNEPIAPSIAPSITPPTPTAVSPPTPRSQGIKGHQTPTSSSAIAPHPSSQKSTPKIGSGSPITAPIVTPTATPDIGDANFDPTQLEKNPYRNQTVNPFVKHNKVNP